MNERTKMVAVVFVVALIVRLLALASLLEKLNPDVDLDCSRSFARSLAGGRGFVVLMPAGRQLPNVARTPGYPLFLTSLSSIGGDRLGLFLVVQCVLGAATCALTVLLAARWLSWRAAAEAAVPSSRKTG